MIIHKFLTATTAACPQARTSTPSTAGPDLRPFGRRVAGAAGGGLTGLAAYGVSWHGSLILGGRG
ncbi:hypothetical protein ABIB35_002035 [Arthrobacter sp. UYP6]|uniref:hypothetical protein n=1 Tax=Arthrobacter sp. UYP6 TaxID=1756378 RepID=UPI003398956B